MMAYTAEDVMDRIVRTDIEDTVINAINVENVEDEELRALLIAARDAINKVDDWMKQKFGEDYGWV